MLYLCGRMSFKLFRSNCQYNKVANEIFKAAESDRISFVVAEDAFIVSRTKYQIFESGVEFDLLLLIFSGHRLFAFSMLSTKSV